MQDCKVSKTDEIFVGLLGRNEEWELETTKVKFVKKQNYAKRYGIKQNKMLYRKKMSTCIHTQPPLGLQ